MLRVHTTPRCPIVIFPPGAVQVQDKYNCSGSTLVKTTCDDIRLTSRQLRAHDNNTVKLSYFGESANEFSCLSTCCRHEVHFRFIPAAVGTSNTQMIKQTGAVDIDLISMFTDLL